MTDLKRLGLGTMGMSNRRNPENSVKTIHAALNAGITLFNTGEFYNGSESELIVGAIAEQVGAGYMRHIGLSMVDAEKLLHLS